MTLNRRDTRVLPELGVSMATDLDSHHDHDPQNSDKLPDLDSVMRKQELIAFVVLVTLVALVCFLIVL
jgi:hypothetical protein